VLNIETGSSPKIVTAIITQFAQFAKQLVSHVIFSLRKTSSRKKEIRKKSRVIFEAVPTRKIRFDSEPDFFVKQQLNIRRNRTDAANLQNTSKIIQPNIDSSPFLCSF
jgi:hypothetical protein